MVIRGSGEKMNPVEIMAQDGRIATGVAAASTSFGIGAIMDLINTGMGILAAFAGFVLSVVLIYTHWKKHRYEMEELRRNRGSSAEKN